MTLTPASSRLTTGTFFTTLNSLEALPQGALAQTHARWAALNSNVTIVSQRVTLSGIMLPAGLTVTSITHVAGTTALVAGVHQIFGIYDDSLGSSSGTARALLRGTSDDGATAWAANASKTLTLTTPYTTTRSGLHYIAILVDAGTPPTINGAQGGTIVDGIAPIYWGFSSAGVTALPDPAAAITVQNAPTYAYLT